MSWLSMVVTNNLYRRIIEISVINVKSIKVLLLFPQVAHLGAFETMKLKFFKRNKKLYCSASNRA